MKAVKKVMEDQAKWQSSRAQRPWAEKLKASVLLRKARKSLKQTRET